MYSLKKDSIKPQDVIVVFHLDNQGKVDGGSLSTYTPTMARFYHYHTIDESRDCTGQLKMDAISNVPDIDKFFKKIESALLVINKDDLGRPDSLSPGLPNVNDIQWDQESEGQWTT